MTRQAKQVLGFFLVLGTVVLLLALVVLADLYGAWVWATPLLPIAVVIGLGIRYQGIRRSAASVASGALDAVAVWWKSLGSNRTKERESIPADVRRSVLDRANGACEAPNCSRRTRNHFHHIDEDPSHNVRSNIVYICPNHHDEVHRGLIPRSEQQRWARRRPKAATRKRSTKTGQKLGS